jgi:hypothetical protein
LLLTTILPPRFVLLDERTFRKWPKIAKFLSFCLLRRSPPRRIPQYIQKNLRLLLWVLVKRKESEIPFCPLHLYGYWIYSQNSRFVCLDQRFFGFSEKMRRFCPIRLVSAWRRPTVVQFCWVVQFCLPWPFHFPFLYVESAHAFSIFQPVSDPVSYDLFSGYVLCELGLLKFRRLVKQLIDEKYVDAWWYNKLLKFNFDQFYIVNTFTVVSVYKDMWDVPKLSLAKFSQIVLS